MLATVATNTERYRAARDQILAIADGTADTFSWPQLTGDFNWATDWFDVIARGNDRTALRIVEEDGSEQSISFAAMAERSDRLAAWLDQLGVGKGDRVVLMLGNQVELWESTLAIAKLGAVVMPATGALRPIRPRRPHHPRRSAGRDRQRRRYRQVRRRRRRLPPRRGGRRYRRAGIATRRPPMSSGPGRSPREPRWTIRC